MGHSVYAFVTCLNQLTSLEIGTITEEKPVCCELFEGWFFFSSEELKLQRNMLYCIKAWSFFDNKGETL